MTYFAVIREPGSSWDRAEPMHQQAGWREHADFMNALAEDRFVVLGGPLGDDGKVLLIVNSPGETAIRQRLDEDPWSRMDLLVVVTIEPWRILLGNGSQMSNAS